MGEPNVRQHLTEVTDVRIALHRIDLIQLPVKCLFGMKTFTPLCVQIYRKYNIVPKRIQGGTLEEVLRPPLKSQGHRTAHQIHLMVNLEHA